MDNIRAYRCRHRFRRWRRYGRGRWSWRNILLSHLFFGQTLCLGGGRLLLD
ncbi:hypothetical protein GCM10009636_24440 [Arthrobacter koreensis]